MKKENQLYLCKIYKKEFDNIWDGKYNERILDIMLKNVKIQGEGGEAGAAKGVSRRRRHDELPECITGVVAKTDSVSH